MRYLDYQSTRKAIFQYIKCWYNHKRIHGSIGFKTPQEMENHGSSVG